MWRSHARGWWECRLQLAAALAVLVGKFAVDDGGSGNLHDVSPCFGLDGRGILAEKGRLKTGGVGFQTALQRFKTDD